MLVVRAVQADDVDPLFDLIQRSEYGLTTLKISKEKLDRRVEESLFAFSRKTSAPDGKPYVFVMEDQRHGKVVGTCTIYSKTGGFEPSYHYEIKTSVHRSEELDILKEIDVLHLRKEHDGPTEIGSLFLSPDYWGGGHGRLLSMSRFLFIAEFPERFEKETIAEMRGVVNSDGHSPFWDAIGSFFFQMKYPRAETITSQSKKFIADLMPEHPIYIPLLPQTAQEVIAKVHKNTRPALAMLEKEGFQFKNRIDIFDGGPTMHCPTSEIRTVDESRPQILSKIRQEIDASKNGDVQVKLVSNGKIDFRACLGKVHSADEDHCEIDNVTALRLNVKVGDQIRTADIKPFKSKTLKPAKKKNVENQ